MTVAPRWKKGRGKPRTPRVRLEVDARRAQLLELGLAAFSHRAYDEVSLDEIARTAGISKGLLYHYFPTKRDYYVATLHIAANDLLARTRSDPALPPLERLDATVRAYLTYVESHAPAYLALMRGGVGSDPEVAAVVDGTRAEFVRRLFEGLPGSPPTPLARLVLRGWIGFVEAASLAWLEDRAVALDQVHTALTTMLVQIVGAFLPPGGP